MNNLRKFMFLAVALLVLFVPLVVSAQSLTYTAGFQLQNLSANLASVVVTYYNQDGTVAATVNDTINANSSKTYFPLSAVVNGFNGSVIVSSDQPLAAIANVLGNNGQRGASYAGFEAGATTVNLPLTMKASYGNNTWFNVQNAGSNSTTVYVSYKPGSCTESASVAPGASRTFNQASNTCLPTGFVGAATVTSTESIVAAVIQVSPNSLFAYNGFTTGSANPVMPLVSSNVYNSGTGIQIQNTGASNTDVTVSYTPSAGFPGAACTETKTVSAGQSVTFGFPQLPVACGTTGTGVTDPVNKGFIGSARAMTNTASMPLVAIVNQINRVASNAAAYNAVNPSTATNRVSLPLIMDRAYNNFTGFAVANVGTLPTDISCTFSGTTYTASATSVAPGSAMTAVQLNQIAPGYVGSGTCTATGGDATIAAVVNQVVNGAPATNDTLFVHNAFNY